MKALTLVALLCLVACEQDPVSVSQTNNPNVAVALLFEHEGCKVYRFEDNGMDHYFANCGASASVVEGHMRSCGKNCTHRVDEEVPTQ